MIIKELASRWMQMVAGAMTLALLLFLFASQALASRVEPEVVRGSPTCSDYSSGGTEFTIHGNERFGVEDSGPYTDGKFTVDVKFYDTPSGQEFDWTSNVEVDVVVAKGGSLASIYKYNPRVTSDTGLHAPFNDTRSLWYPSTYISFCYHPPQAKPVAESTTTTELVVETTQPTSLATTTTKPAEVLPTVVTTSVPTTSSTTPGAGPTTTKPAEVKGTEVLPFTGMTNETLWLLAVSLVAAGSTAVFSARKSRRDEE